MARKKPSRQPLKESSTLGPQGCSDQEPAKRGRDRRKRRQHWEPPDIRSIDELEGFLRWNILRRTPEYQADVDKLLADYPFLRAFFPKAFQNYPYPPPSAAPAFPEQQAAFKAFQDHPYPPPSERFKGFRWWWGGHAILGDCVKRPFHVSDPRLVDDSQLPPVLVALLRFWKKWGIQWPVPSCIERPHPDVLDMLEPPAVYVLGRKGKRRGSKIEVRGHGYTTSKIVMAVDWRRPRKEIEARLRDNINSIKDIQESLGLIPEKKTRRRGPHILSNSRPCPVRKLGHTWVIEGEKVVVQQHGHEAGIMIVEIDLEKPQEEIFKGLMTEISAAKKKQKKCRGIRHLDKTRRIREGNMAFKVYDLVEAGLSARQVAKKLWPDEYRKYEDRLESGKIYSNSVIHRVYQSYERAKRLLVESPFKLAPGQTS